MVFLETALESKFNPLVALGRNGALGLSGFVNKFNSEAELLDDLVRVFFSYAWYMSTSNSWQKRTITGLLEAIRFDISNFGRPRLGFKPISQRERNWLIEQFQNFARFHRIRVTFLSGDVHCAAVGVLKTLKVKNKPEISPLTDYRYMVNIVTSKFWRLNHLRFVFDIPSFPRCHCEHTTVSRSILFRPFRFSLIYN